MAIKLHPSIDKGVKAGAKKFKGGTLTCQCASDPVTVTHQGQRRAQPRLRLHQVLEARGRRVLAWSR